MGKWIGVLAIAVAAGVVWFWNTERPAAEMPAETVLGGTSHETGLDPFGYYLPATDIRIGDLALSHIHIGGEGDLSAYEAGERVSPVYAPFMMQFDDMTSAEGVNELGQTYREVSFRVLPAAYRLYADDVRFVGIHEELGNVTFEGKLDRDALDAALKGENNVPVLTGTLTAGGQTFENLAFVWYGGD